MSLCVYESFDTHERKERRRSKLIHIHTPDRLHNVQIRMDPLYAYVSRATRAPASTASTWTNAPPASTPARSALTALTCRAHWCAHARILVGMACPRVTSGAVQTRTSVHGVCTTAVDTPRSGFLSYCIRMLLCVRERAADTNAPRVRIAEFQFLNVCVCLCEVSFCE